MKKQVLITSANLFKALGHAKRLEIITLLQGHELTVNQIVQMTSLRQAAVSQHLMLLKETGLVSDNKLGKEIYYSLNPEPFSSLTKTLHTLTRLSPVEENEPTVIDPICQMSLTPSIVNYTCMYGGVKHYFCGKGCLKEFNLLHKGNK